MQHINSLRQVFTANLLEKGDAYAINGTIREYMRVAARHSISAVPLGLLEMLPSAELEMLRADALPPDAFFLPEMAALTPDQIFWMVSLMKQVTDGATNFEMGEFGRVVIVEPSDTLASLGLAADEAGPGYLRWEYAEFHPAITLYAICQLQGDNFGEIFLIPTQHANEEILEMLRALPAPQLEVPQLATIKDLEETPVATA
jgi:hypothetical protein